jgi:hypothetical protein
MPRTRTAVLAFAADALLVLVFVLIGRASHDENPLLGALETYWPFAVGLVIGWAVSRGWRAPLALPRTGIPVWVCTVAIGILLRVVTLQGAQLSFVIVTAVVLAVFLVGWRALALPARRIRSKQTASREP